MTTNPNPRSLSTENLVLAQRSETESIDLLSAEIDKLYACINNLKPLRVDAHHRRNKINRLLEERRAQTQTREPTS